MVLTPRMRMFLPRLPNLAPRIARAPRPDVVDSARPAARQRFPCVDARARRVQLVPDAGRGLPGGRAERTQSTGRTDVRAGASLDPLCFNAAMARKSTFVVLWEWVTGKRRGDPSASNERIVAEVAGDLDALRMDGVTATDRVRVSRHALEALGRCGPFRDPAAYTRFLLASARALSGCGLLGDVPTFLRGGLDHVDAHEEASTAIQDVLDELDPIASAIKDGRIAGPRLSDAEQRQLRVLMDRLRAIPYREGPVEST